jgi:hypothetical protein
VSSLIRSDIYQFYTVLVIVSGLSGAFDADYAIVFQYH